MVVGPLGKLVEVGIKEETKGKKLDSGISVSLSLSPSFFPS